YDERNALTRKISGYESESDADRKTRIDSRKEQYKAKKAREAQARAERNEKHESEKKARKEAKRRDIGVTGLRSNTGQPSPPFDSTPTTVKKNGGPSKK
ncbi:MAG: hypothetical protein LBT34_00190, partial [Clostridiales Family XIII bacterium]|nr:hypothetical protein [Clostridiales Family XIII bacterium]